MLSKQHFISKLVGCIAVYNDSYSDVFTSDRTMDILIWIIGQEPTVFAVGAGWGCLNIFFSCLCWHVSFSHSLGLARLDTDRDNKPNNT